MAPSGFVCPNDIYLPIVVGVIISWPYLECMGVSIFTPVHLRISEIIIIQNED